jgi:beta-lactamase superfamily II metal-dependent hydrolase
MNKKTILVFGLVILIILFWSFYSNLPDGKLHIVFCDVGQGDAAYIKMPDGEDMIIDGGPDSSLLSCLGRHMSIFDRTIDLVMMTHPQEDHSHALPDVVDRYTVKYFVMGNEGNNTPTFNALIKNLKSRKVPIKVLYAGNSFRMGDVSFKILWPSAGFVQNHIFASDSAQLTTIPSSNVLGAFSDIDLNSFSYIAHISLKSFDAVFTGDADDKIDAEIMRNSLIPKVEVLKFPHHGSRTAITPEFLDALSLQFAVISVGKNTFGHPSSEAINLLTSRNVKYMRTDQKGDIEVISDGETWTVKTQK